MNSGVKKEKSKIFEMVLSSPGMTELCKISMKISRQHVLILGRLLEAGILDENNKFEDDVLGSLSQESITEFKTLHEEILKKAGLTEFYEKLKSL